MTQDEALQIVYRALERLNEELDAPVDITPHTQLFGADAVIDSLSLVSVIVDVEAEASEAIGQPVSLTDDRAINQPVSPFRDPQTLAAYIVSLQG
jgi:acyl carrier protein